MENKNFSHSELFSRPLILGASISAGYGTQDGGPGSVLARMLNPLSQITNLAKNGATSVQSTSRVDFKKYNPTLIMGFDLFFWDVARSQIDSNFESHTRSLFKAFQDLNAPVILGQLPEVPSFLSGKFSSLIKNAKKVNLLLEELASKDSKVVLYNPLECLLSMDSSEYFSDGLHLSRKGNQYCANYILNSQILDKFKLSQQN